MFDAKSLRPFVIDPRILAAYAGRRRKWSMSVKLLPTIYNASARYHKLLLKSLAAEGKIVARPAVIGRGGEEAIELFS